MKKIILLLLLPTVGLFSIDLNLNDYINLVEENSKELSLAQLDKQLALTQEKLARSATRPMIAGQIGYSRNFIELTQPYPVAVDTSGGGIQALITKEIKANYKNEFTYGIGLQQTIFDMKIFKALEASTLYKDLSGSVYEATRQAIITAAKKVYYLNLLTEEVLQVKISTEENAYENYIDTKKKFNSEIASELNVLQAEVNWRINVPETTLAQRNRDIALSNLKIMAGLVPSELIVFIDTLEAIPPLPITPPIPEIFGKRPDYQIKLQTKALNNIQLAANKAEFYPSLSASATYGWGKYSDEFEFDDGTGTFSLGLQVSVPIYYGGSRFSKLEKSKLEIQKSQLEIQKSREGILSDINDLELELNEASSRIESAQTTLLTAKKAYKIMEISSRSGLATQLDLKDTLLNLDGAQLNFYVAIYDYLNAYFDWQVAIGEGDKPLPN